MRNPDGSWTVEVHPNPGAGQAPGAYPQPRKPMTQPVPIQAPASGVAPPPSAPQWQGGPPQGQPPQYVAAPSGGRHMATLDEITGRIREAVGPRPAP